MSHNPSLLTNRQVASRMIRSSAYYADQVAENNSILALDDNLCQGYRGRIATVSTMALLQGEHDLMHSIIRIEKADDEQLQRIIALLCAIHRKIGHA